MDQLHITHRSAYLSGWRNGENGAKADHDYRPNDGATGTNDEKLAYRIGYTDGWTTVTSD